MLAPGRRVTADPLRFSGNLWVQQSAVFATNSGVFLSEGQALLVDPGVFPHEVDGLAAWLAAQGARAAVVALTHAHWDHLLGAARFPDASVITHTAYGAVVATHEADLARQVAAWQRENDLGGALPFAAPTPDQVFTDERALVVGGLTLRLIAAPGHTPDQFTLYEPQSGALWAADMLSDQEIPFVGGGLGAYEATLAALAGWDIRALVPGHGAPTNAPDEIAARVAGDRAYLVELRGRVERAVAAGYGITETVTLCSDMQFRYPEANAEPHRRNVESAYVELGGEPPPYTSGWDREWAL
jgi:glyoxylase-like metal-dependent hydrolase (beta-lactamase superfamily II)